jgi:hypothetical protein
MADNKDCSRRILRVWRASLAKYYWTVQTNQYISHQSLAQEAHTLRRILCMILLKPSYNPCNTSFLYAGSFTALAGRKFRSICFTKTYKLPKWTAFIFVDLILRSGLYGAATTNEEIGFRGSSRKVNLVSRHNHSLKRTKISSVARTALAQWTWVCLGFRSNFFFGYGIGLSLIATHNMMSWHLNSRARPLLYPFSFHSWLD